MPAVGAHAAEPRLEEIRALRDDVRAVLHAAADRQAPPPRAAARLNARVRALPLVPRLGPGPGELHHVPATRAGAVDELLARVAAATVELGRPGRPERRALLRRAELRSVLRPQPRRPALVRARVRDARAGRPPRRPRPRARPRASAAVLVAPTAFDGLRAPAVAAALGRGLEAAGFAPPALCPLSGGGAGTIEVLLPVLGGETADGFALVEDGATAFVEAAAEPDETAARIARGGGRAARR